MNVFVPSSDDVTVTVVLKSKFYSLRFYDFRELTYVDISVLGERLSSGVRVIQNQWLLPDYATHDGGNFRFKTYKSDDDEYVHYSGYNVKFRLEAFTEDEIQALQE